MLQLMWPCRSWHSNNPASLPLQVPPPIFNFWMCVGILISSAPALAAGQVG